MEERIEDMKTQKQRIVNSKRGDCFRACVSTVLQIPDKFLLNNHSKCSFLIWMKTLHKFGIEVRYGKNCWIDGYWIATVPSKNFKGIKHSIVMKGQKVFFDPSTKKKYMIGENLLGKQIVEGGYTFLISDIEKFHSTYNEVKKCLEK